MRRLSREQWVRRLLGACEDAPGDEADLLAAILSEELRVLQEALRRAEAEGLVRWHYRRWWLTDAGRERLGKSETAI